jgi:hypothetical protein
MWCVSILGVHYYVLFMATVENTFLDGDAASTFRAFTPTQSEETYSKPPTVSGHRFWCMFSNKRWLHLHVTVGHVIVHMTLFQDMC